MLLSRSPRCDAHVANWAAVTFVLSTSHRLHDRLSSHLTQDDCVVGHQCTILSLADMDINERMALVEQAEKTPFSDDTCLCDSITEPDFVQCPRGQYDGTPENPCYGARGRERCRPEWV